MTLNRLVIAQPPTGLQRTIILDQTNENASFFTPSEQTYIKEEKESLGIPLWDADPSEWEQYLWKKHQNEKLGVKENLERTLGHIGLGGSILHYWYKLQRVLCTKRSKPTQPHLFRSKSIQNKIKENEWRSGATKWFSNLKPLPLQTQRERTPPSLGINFENSNQPSSPHAAITSNSLSLLNSNYAHPLYRPYESRLKALAGIEILQSLPQNHHQPKNQTPDQPLPKAAQALLVRFDNPLMPAQHDTINSPAQQRPNSLILNAIADPSRVAPNMQAQKAIRVPRSQVPVGIRPMARDQQDQRPTFPENLSSSNNLSGSGIFKQQSHSIASPGIVPGANASNNFEVRNKDLLDHIKRPAGLRERDLNIKTDLKEISLPGIRKLEESEKERSASPTVKRIFNENESPRVIRYRHPLPMDEENT